MTKSRKLVYRISPHNGSVVFADPKRAQLVDRLNRAIRTSRTWAEFRNAVPRDEYSNIVQFFDREGDPRPKGADAFDSEALPGFSDGDYPPWLQQEMDQFLPQSFFERFATRESTVLNGSVWTIPPEKLADVLDAMKARGYDVQECDDLDFC